MMTLLFVRVRRQVHPLPERGHFSLGHPLAVGTSRPHGHLAPSGRIPEIVVNAKHYVAAIVGPPPLDNRIRDRRNITCGATSIEHIVAASEAHDSGLCAADAATKARFARDLRNLTLAAPAVNRYQKSGKDAAEWVPARNGCWFAARVVDVRRAYALTIDRREAAAIDRILASCGSTALEPIVCAARSRSKSAAGTATGDDALARYDDNRNGMITCKEARRHGIAPVPRSHPAYRYMRDGDGDGVVCE